ncbi:hypothetical protein LQZ21_06810 [Treponema sp. TIM-1]|uniref:PG0541 family transporter-associated protein n=1 Tax=Treponema sp. TIM-1 TaxID=2898417 RepID=UPI00397F17DC
MKRMELMANRSVEEEIINALEVGIGNFFYTLLPVVHGRGKTQYRLGTPTWPEENFLLISYLHDRDAEAAQSVVVEIKNCFPQEGIKTFFIDSDG